MNRRALLAVVLALAAASCATVPGPQPPEVVAATVRNVEIRLPTVRADVELVLFNPNASAIAVTSLQAELDIADQRAGALRLAAPVTLPPQASTAVTVSTVGDAAIALAGIGRALGSGVPLDYAIRGTLVLADGTSWPFLRRGHVATSGRRP